MFLLFPYKINTLLQQLPFVNWALILITSLTSLIALYVGNGDWAIPLILDGWSVSGLLGHMFLHGDFFHLLGNMIFLWVFGNAICGNSGNVIYIFSYLLFGLVGGASHLVLDEGMGVGASGAINGIVGMALAMYPKNRVSLFYFFWIIVIFKTGKFEIPLWAIALFWLVWDILYASSGVTDVAAWAHLGGFVAGLVTGLVFLRLNIVRLTEWDNESLDQIFLGR